jgi:hypothetical protein
MPKLIKPPTPSNVILRLKLMDGTSTSGAGLKGLTSGSSGLRISTIKSNEATPVAYVAVSGTIQDITTLGTYETPAALSCRFKEVDSLNHPGLYELQLADSRFDSNISIISINGAASLAEADFEIQCENIGADVRVMSSSVVLSASQPYYAPATSATEMKLTVQTISDIRDGLLKRTDQIDGESVEYIFELMMAMANGNFELDGDTMTLYERDNVTPLSVINRTTTSRTRVS